ncbi:MAG TPA: trehalose-phosphatase [Longimicrobiales bacterium]
MRDAALATETRPGAFDAAVFDLDGVVTFTARVHAAAWKELFDEYLRSRERRLGEQFRPFTDADYRRHVDGRPRRDGVRTFLASRGITLPEGGDGDPPDAETVAGLGRRKDERFQLAIREHGADVDREAVRFIGELRRRGVRVGVASSSRNVRMVLETAGLAGLFEASVDGVVSERLGLAGKPAPDIFLTCLALLDVPDPRRAIVVEDAVAGVEAGRAGNFGLVLGVDRAEQATALREHGADIVISDFRDVTPERIDAFFANRQHARANALVHFGEIALRLQGRRLAVFLDYDGTLTPIVDRPELARLSPEMRVTLRDVAAVWPTTIVSGRGREDVTTLVGVDGLHYAGSHGFDIAGPDIDGSRYEPDPGVAPVVGAAAAELRSRTADIPGVIVEDKKYSVAVHYRLVSKDRVADVERSVDEALARRPQLRKAAGKKVFELRPSMDWDKGRAMLWLLRALGLDGRDVLPLYIGDDVTDEDAFAALERRGIGILVTDVPRPTAAHYSLRDVTEVRALLDRLASLPAGMPA